jgi:hypothetical protein
VKQRPLGPKINKRFAGTTHSRSLRFLRRVAARWGAAAAVRRGGASAAGRAAAAASVAAAAAASRSASAATAPASAAATTAGGGRRSVAAAASATAEETTADMVARRLCLRLRCRRLRPVHPVAPTAASELRCVPLAEGVFWKMPRVAFLSPTAPALTWLCAAPRSRCRWRSC